MNEFNSGEAVVEPSSQVDLSAILDSSISLFGENEGFDDIISDLKQLRSRYASGTFRLAVLGQFKRGKSTLLNALLGDNLLPTDILPVTAIPTFISASPQLQARVVFQNKSSLDYPQYPQQSVADFLSAFVTEAGNPNNQQQVERVEIGHPAEILRMGLVLIDTPGVGSTFKHNTEVALRILPQCDAALFLVSPEPPITQSEIDYLKEVRRVLPRTFYLLNKVDTLDDRQRDVSIDFLARQLAIVTEATPPIFSLSARQGLQAKLSGDDDAWRRSGMKRLSTELINFFAEEKQETLESSILLRLTDQLNVLRLQLDLQLQTLLLPQSELKEKIAQFKLFLVDIAREKLVVADALVGDEKRMAQHLTAEAEKVRIAAKKQLLEPLEDYYINVEDIEELEREVRFVLNSKVASFFGEQMHQVAATINAEASALLQLHQQRMNVLLEKVRKTAAEIFSIPYHAPMADQAYVTFTSPHWSDDLFISDMDPFGQRLSRKLFRHNYRRKKTIKRLRDESLRLIGQNVEQINWTLRRGVDESFRQYGAQLNDQLDKTLDAINQALELALHKSDKQFLNGQSRESLMRELLAKLVPLQEALEWIKAKDKSDVGVC
jgi:ribosome biogenesis GTPase A